MSELIVIYSMARGFRGEFLYSTVGGNEELPILRIGLIPRDVSIGPTAIPDTYVRTKLEINLTVLISLSKGLDDLGGGGLFLDPLDRQQ